MDRSQLARQIVATNPNGLPMAKQFNPIVLLILEEVIRILLEKCTLALSSVQNPWIWDKWLLKRYIETARRNVMESKFKSVSYEPYDGSLADIYDSLLAYGKTLDKVKLNKLVKEVQ